MKKSLTILSALLMLSGAGAGIPLSQVVTPTPTAQAASLNAAKLANGKYSVAYSIFKTGTSTPSDAAAYFNLKANVVAKNKKTSVALKTTAAANQMIQSITLGGKQAKVTKSSTGNVYTFSNVNLKKSQTIGFSLSIPNMPQIMKESATLKFKTSSLAATTKVKLSTKKIKAKAKKVTGTTTKGAKVTVKHGTKTLGKVTSKKKAYTVKLKKAVKKSWKLKVTASKAGYRTVTKTVTVK
ncbi:NEAT domain-containing protein [Levilactobacillus tongjiangensis]|uniref:NEAT domain-containing protein n=1 Tax=Levilactobacillus tongjiangensis TaxID=2486023 RepID=A0ABW1SUU0_9LACO|nr:NEAT domain-containing protein [Levilactobacillus tongjiangensis]